MVYRQLPSGSPEGSLDREPAKEQPGLGEDVRSKFSPCDLGGTALRMIQATDCGDTDVDLQYLAPTTYIENQ